MIKKVTVDGFGNWLINKNLKESTIEIYCYYFSKFTYDYFNQETVSKFLSVKAHRNSVARSFLINYQKFLKVNYKELGLSDDIRIEISEVELPQITGRTKKRLINPIPHEQIKVLLGVLKEEVDKIQLLLSYYCGLRLGELLKITINSFNWDEWKKDPDGVGECRVFGKGDKEGIALVPAAVMKRIALYIHKSKDKRLRNKTMTSVGSRLFMDDNAINKLRNRGRGWQMKLKKAGIDSGITKIDGEGKPIKETIVHPHRLRHSYGDYLLNHKKLNLREVQELLRHSSITSTQIYTKINKEKLKEKLRD